MTSYEVYFSREVYQTLTDLDEAVETRLLNYIDTLATNPFQESDLVEYNAVARRDCQIKILQTVAVYYWVDHADKEVRVVKLISAEDSPGA